MTGQRNFQRTSRSSRVTIIVIFYHLYYRISILRLNLVLRYPSLTKCITERLEIHNVQLHIDYKINSPTSRCILVSFGESKEVPSKRPCFSFLANHFCPNLEHLEYYILGIGCVFGCFSSNGINLPHLLGITLVQHLRCWCYPCFSRTL